MLDVPSLYDAATRAGLLTPVRFGTEETFVDFRSPDEDVLGGLGVSRDYAIRYPAGRLSRLAAGESIEIDGRIFRVREITLLGDGAEKRASLTLV